jgi:GAF domain/Sel1 repeat/PilZ domain
MGQSTLTPSDASRYFPQGDRRRCVRQKLHTPVYASFNGPQTGMVVDLSELLDLNENGFAVQTAITGKDVDDKRRFELNHAVSLCLDLPETRSFVHGSGEVVWTDDAGRVGIRFSFLPDASRKILKEWLFVNLLIASANHAARTEQVAHRQQEDAFAWDFSAEGEPHDEEPFVEIESGTAAVADPSPAPIAPDATVPNSSPVENVLPFPVAPPSSKSDGPALALVPPPEHTAALTTFDDIRREVRDYSASPEAIFQVIATSARTLTGASGAALAMSTDGVMICCAREGDPAPPIGYPVNVKEGLSGECARSGLPVQCQDTATDPRVDAELCRDLGIGSLLAVPILADFRVVGLLEVFSSNPHNFVPAHIKILDRLVELIPKTQPKKIEPQLQIEKPKPASPEVEAVRAEAPPAEVSQDGLPTSEAPIPEDSAVDDLVIRIPVETPRSASQPTESEPVASEPVASLAVEPPPLPLPPLEGKPDLYPIRAALGESKPAPELQATQDIPESPEDAAPGPWHRRLHFKLLLTALAVAALALGYVLAPFIEKHWFPAQASQAALQSALESPTVAQASWNQTTSSRVEAHSPQEVRKRADQGDPGAQYSLGVRYHNGEGVLRDDSQAVQWYLRSANQGYVPAQSALGAYYEAGRGVPQDFSKAYFWTVLAVAQGDENSKFRQQDLTARMSRSQIAAAHEQAESWLHSHRPATKSN